MVIYIRAGRNRWRAAAGDCNTTLLKELRLTLERKVSGGRLRPDNIGVIDIIIMQQQQQRQAAAAAASSSSSSSKQQQAAAAAC